MASSPRPTKRVADRDGVKLVRTGPDYALRFVSALALLGIAAWLVARWRREDVPAPVTAAPSSTDAKVPRVPPSTPAAVASSTDTAPRKETAASAPDPPPRAHHREEPRKPEKMPPDEMSDDEEPRFTVNPPGEHAGIAAFPPPGTKPLKRGIVVPDDFELPEGYVRHYQTADDGRTLPPILMFHPDYQPVDADGKPLPMPEDRIVPPEMAPPGLRVRTLGESEDQTGRVRRARDAAGAATPDGER